MAVVVAGRAHDGWRTLAGERGEPVWVARGADGVDRHLYVAIGAVLEADGHREARGQFAVHLALHRARADGAPRDEVGVVLAERGIEKLRGHRQAEARDADHELAGEAEALVDLIGAVAVGVVDEALPAHDGAWFFKVHAHHDLEFARVERRGGVQARGVVERGGGIVDRAGADDDEQTVVRAGEDRGGLAAGAGDGPGPGVGERQLILQHGGRDERLGGADTEVGSGRVHAVG